MYTNGIHSNNGRARIKFPIVYFIACAMHYVLLKSRITLAISFIAHFVVRFYDFFENPLIHYLSNLLPEFGKYPLW